ncbi:MAG: protein phosphatase 2C domain-containing protein, partial [Candidatus Marinimicrobia bacterium]|nr:protein phosphatase 2C domain-containing protein [Candidatus Neomarinimicrobiota bacterium]
MSEDQDKKSLVWHGLTDVSRFRKTNEDAFLALTFDEHGVQYLGKDGDASLGDGDFIFAVSDGMGGAKAGEFASKITVDKVTEMMPRCFRSASGGTDFLLELIPQIHNQMRMHSRSYEECNGMGATLSLCWVTPDMVYFAHVGDSRIYY